MSKQDKLDRVPPYLPIIWQDWLSDPDVRSMTMAQRGIFLEILLQQWVFGDVPRDPWKLSKDIKADYRTTVKFLQTYSKTLACIQCHRCWNAVKPQCQCSDLTGRVHNRKLHFLSIDVKLNLPLGTTEANRTEPEPNPLQAEDAKSAVAHGK
jgi:hypothetical protein